MSFTHTVTRFSFVTPGPGEFRWQCFIPCGLATVDGNGHAMSTACRPLGIAGTLLLGFLANWLSAALADSALLVYVLVYTVWLKRRTPSNIVIGGAAGCFPVLVGWAAVTGTIGWPALVLFAVIFFWTPPHFWALAMKFKDDYAKAGIPMLPVVAPPTVVGRRIIAYYLGDSRCDPLAHTVRGMDLRSVRRHRRRLVPGRGTPDDAPDRIRQTPATRPVVPLLDRLPDAAFHGSGHYRSPAVGTLVAGEVEPLSTRLPDAARGSKDELVLLRIPASAGNV